MKDEKIITDWLKENGYFRVDIIPNIGIIADGKMRRMIVITDVNNMYMAEKKARKLNRDLWRAVVDGSDIIWSHLKSEVKI